MAHELTVQELSDQASGTGLKTYLAASLLAHIAHRHPELKARCQALSKWELPSQPRALRRFYAPPVAGTRGVLFQTIREVSEELGLRIDFDDAYGYNSQRFGADTAPGVTLGWVDDRHQDLLSFAQRDPDALVLRHYAKLDQKTLEELSQEKTWAADLEVASSPAPRRSPGLR